MNERVYNQVQVLLEQAVEQLTGNEVSEDVSVAVGS